MRLPAPGDLLVTSKLITIDLLSKRSSWFEVRVCRIVKLKVTVKLLSRIPLFFFFFLEKKRACFLEYLGSWSCFTLIRSLIVIVVARKTRVPLVLKRT